MAREINRLSALAVKRQAIPGYYPDGAGLYLQVSASGSKSWIFRFKIRGREREMGLGAYPDVPLAGSTEDVLRDGKVVKVLREGARERALQARALLREGIDPIEHRKANQSKRLSDAARMVTFKRAALDYIDAHSSGWKNAKHSAQWLSTLEKHAFPKLGDMLVPHIELANVLEVLRPIWTKTPETASRVRGRIESVIAYGDKESGVERPNPARWKGHLDTQLAQRSKVRTVKHHEAMAIDDIGAFMVDLRAAAGMAARALELAILTAARSGEVRGATWGEIDLDAKVWSIPGTRMKMGRPHRIALSTVAIALLRARHADAADEDGNVKPDALIFPAPTKGGPLSDMALLQVLRRRKLDAVPHGFRSTFRDWAAERTAYPAEVAEMALAHAVADQVEAAYRRGDLLAKRFAIMEDWAQFIAKPAPAKGKVVPLRGAVAA